MVKVTIRRLRAGLTGASGLMLLQQTEAGCAAPALHERVGTDLAADSTIDPGTGTLTLSPYWSSSGYLHYSLASQGSVDEFVRVGEQVTFATSAYNLWNALKPYAA